MATASTHLLGLWIDLVRQLAGETTTRSAADFGGLSWQQLRALECVPEQGLTVVVLARRLRVSPATARVIVAQLLHVGAVSNHSDPLDGALVRLMATTRGVRLSADHRSSQTAVLAGLLEQLPVAGRAGIDLAMRQLAVSVTSSPPVGSGLRPE